MSSTLAQSQPGSHRDNPSPLLPTLAAQQRATDDSAHREAFEKAIAAIGGADVLVSLLGERET
jgi:hypothetical protein